MLRYFSDGSVSKLALKEDMLMKKVRLVPLEEEKKFIVLDRQLDKITAAYSIQKKRMLRYNEKGYEFRLIRPSDTSGGVFAPPWKKIAMELVAKLYPVKKLQKNFFARLAKRFPRTERAPSLIILGKRVATNQEQF
jgi:hypothetical protein